MGIFQQLMIWAFIAIPVLGLAETKLKIDNKSVFVGETLNYKATWGFLTIGSASTRIDTNLHKVGSTVCYKVDIAGQTNGMAKLFYLHDKWVSYIDTATITTHKSSRTIREGHYELDEQIHFDAANRKAEVKVYNKKSKSFVLK